DNTTIEQRIGHINFYSATYRLFKIDGLESACEDYGQAVVYKGGVQDSEQVFVLDQHHIIEKGRQFPVCGNSYRMLNESRFHDFFEYCGSWDTHFGIFKGCGTTLPFKSDERVDDAGTCC
ncbi:MAG: methyltransferase type 11, partial [Deltaproteobacteria bacterium]|nr:methyltransferase type 11 [Deltaproteobacteria bacterium]